MQLCVKDVCVCGGVQCQEINLSSCQASQIINHTNDNGDTQCIHTNTHTHTRPHWRLVRGGGGNRGQQEEEEADIISS